MNGHANSHINIEVDRLPSKLLGRSITFPGSLRSPFFPSSFFFKLDMLWYSSVFVRGDTRAQGLLQSRLLKQPSLYCCGSIFIWSGCNSLKRCGYSRYSNNLFWHLFFFLFQVNREEQCILEMFISSVSDSQSHWSNKSILFSNCIRILDYYHFNL